MTVWNWTPSSIAPEYPGFSPDLVDQIVEGALPAAGGILDLPGPAPGFTHRVYEQWYATSNTLAAPFAAPALTGSFNGAMTSFLNGGAGASSFGPNSTILQSGEFFRFTNNSPAAPGRVWAPYYDVVQPNWTVVRTTITDVASDIIPAPPVGSIRRIVLAGFFLTTSRSLNIRYHAYNADTIGQSIEFLQGGNVIHRSNNIGAGVSNIVFPGPVPVTAGAPLQARTCVPIATNPVNMFFAYETI